MSDVNEARTIDHGRGQFCAVTKGGLPLNAPPTRRPPVSNRETNPRGVLHPFKTRQDSQPVKERKRYQDWLKRQGS